MKYILIVFLLLFIPNLAFTNGMRDPNQKYKCYLCREIIMKSYFEFDNGVKIHVRHYKEFKKCRNSVFRFRIFNYCN